MRHPPGIELLDDPGADPDAVRTSLGNIARSNRLFGGTAAVLYGLDRLLAADPRTSDLGSRTSTVTLLDLGTGAGDIPAAARRWAGARGITLRSFGLERLRPAALMSRDRALPMTLGCVSALPFRARSVDFVTISQLLHHCDAATAIALLRDAGRIARRGVVVADLLRSGTAAFLFSLAARALGFDRHTRIDGTVSVARGYAVEELQALCAAAGADAEVVERPGWRVVAWWPAPALQGNGAA
jgi:SAM-dependent methyltransferase